MRHEKSGAKRKLGQEKWGDKSGAQSGATKVGHKVGREKWGEKSEAIKVAQREKWGEKSEP